MTRTKSAIIVSIGIGIAVTVLFSFDYTDKYIADRFFKALAAEQYEPGTPFSLGTFLEYYDWDTVCVVVGDNHPELKNQFGLTYTPKADDNIWSLVFIKGSSVEAEIPIPQDILGSPLDSLGICIERWAAIVEIINSDTGKEMIFVGH